MENIRFLLYMAAIGIGFLILTGIKILMPEEEYTPPVDKIGMKLYRPIFFGGKRETTSAEVIKTETKEIPEEEPPEKTLIKDSELIVDRTVNLSTSKDETYFLEMIRDYQANVLSKRKYRNDVVVRYYRHESDEAKAQLLVDFGFYLHERPVDKSRFKNISSNVIYFGNGFPERDLKLITYLLVKNGIPIKRLQPFKNYNGWKKNSIEIGGNPKLTEKPTLTFSEIRSFSVPK